MILLFYSMYGRTLVLRPQLIGLVYWLAGVIHLWRRCPATMEKEM